MPNLRVPTEVLNPSVDSVIGILEKYDFEEHFVLHRFEEVCRQYLVRQNRVGKIPEVFSEIGKCWYDNPVTHTNGEFDIVTRDPRVPTHVAAVFARCWLAYAARRAR